MAEYNTLREKIAAEKAEKIALQQKWVEVLRTAHEAGLDAVANLHVLPMIVADADVLTGEFKPGGKQYYVADGVCGFAYVILSGKPGEGKRFINWLSGTAKPQRPELAPNLNAMQLYIHKGYHGGHELSVMNFNQSMQKKETYARAFAAVLHEKIENLTAYSRSQMD